MQAAILFLQLVHAKRPVYRPRQNLGFEWLGAEIVRPKRDRLQRIDPVVLPGEHDDLGVGRKCIYLLEQQESFARIVRMRRQPQIHRDDGRLAAAHLRDRRFPIAGHDRFIPVERPAHLFLQLRIVLDDQQRPARFGHAVPPATAVAGVLAFAARQQHAHARTPPGLAVDLYPPAEALDVLRALVDADPHTRGLRGLEWPEQPLADELRTHACSRVLYIDQRESAVVVQLDRDAAAFARRVDRVLHQVADHVLETILVPRGRDAGR